MVVRDGTIISVHTLLYVHNTILENLTKRTDDMGFFSVSVDVGI